LGCLFLEAIKFVWWFQWLRVGKEEKKKRNVAFWFSDAMRHELCQFVLVKGNTVN
jgi:nicotinamide riboside transporter PnuC